MEGVNRILRYLKQLLVGLMFRRTDKRCTEAYIDFDWIGSMVDHPSLAIVPLCGAIS